MDRRNLWIHVHYCSRINIVVHCCCSAAYQRVLDGLGIEDALVHLEEGLALQILAWSVLPEAFGLESCAHACIRLSVSQSQL